MAPIPLGGLHPHELSTFQKLCLQIPPHWGVEFQHRRQILCPFHSVIAEEYLEPVLSLSSFKAWTVSEGFSLWEPQVLSSWTAWVSGMFLNSLALLPVFSHWKPRMVNSWLRIIIRMADFISFKIITNLVSFISYYFFLGGESYSVQLLCYICSVVYSL